MMLVAEVNIEQIAKNLTDRFERVDFDKMTREIAVDVMRRMKTRIHIDGKNSKGSSIGRYSVPYQKKRRERGRKEGAKVVLSFNRQLENDYQIVLLQEGGYGIGFSNPHNMDKMNWNNKRYGTPIFAMSDDEKKAMRDIVKRYVDEVGS